MQSCRSVPAHPIKHTLYGVRFEFTVEHKPSCARNQAHNTKYMFWSYLETHAAVSLIRKAEARLSCRLPPVCTAVGAYEYCPNSRIECFVLKEGG